MAQAPPFELTTIPETFQRVAAAYPDKPAVIYLGTPFTYKKLDELTDRFAAGLQELGHKPGTKAVMYLPNSVQWLTAWIGLLKAGLVPVPITPIYTHYDVEYISNDTGAEIIVCTDRNYGYVNRIMENTNVRTVIPSNMADMLPPFKRLFGWISDRVPHGSVERSETTIPITDLLKRAPARPAPVDASPDDLAEILYTGGTTKHPKGVPITHALALKCSHEQISVCAALFPLDQNVVLGSAPMFHILGQVTALGAILLHGGTIILQPRVNLDAVFNDIARYKAKTLIGVPALYRMILEHDRLDQYDLSSLSYCFSGGDVMPVELADRWRKRFGNPVYIGYGASETVGGVSMTSPDEAPPQGAMGKVLHSKDVLILDMVEREPVEQGQPGELLVHSDPMVTSYWNKPKETSESFVEKDGRMYYCTRDIVRRDENGWLFFVDRTVDTIKHKGYRISASEIESVLQDHPAVILSCVVGVPDEKVGERIKAFVVLKKDVKGITGYELIDFCRQRLASYKIPQYIEFRDMLPMSKVGKLLRREIRAEEMSRVS
ncbi:MAG: AMP-binding protein [Proteobacteria bacterium]|nr:AMP-binding protein [Pseudomonadota bacterium]